MYFDPFQHYPHILYLVLQVDDRLHGRLLLSVNVDQQHGHHSHDAAHCLGRATAAESYGKPGRGQRFTRVRRGKSRV